MARVSMSTGYVPRGQSKQREGGVRQVGRRGGRGDPREKLRVYRGRTGACEAMAAAAAAVTVLDVPVLAARAFIVS